MRRPPVFDARERKLQEIANAAKRISAGEMISMNGSSYSANNLCIGDFREIGWSERISTRDSLYWNWNGPSPIIVDGVIIVPGGSTEEFLMDWS
jgi:hypothetical protein